MSGTASKSISSMTVISEACYAHDFTRECLNTSRFSPQNSILYRNNSQQRAAVNFVQHLMTAAFYLSMYSYLESLDQLSTINLRTIIIEFKFTIDCVFFVTTQQPTVCVFQAAGLSPSLPETSTILGSTRPTWKDKR